MLAAGQTAEVPQSLATGDTNGKEAQKGAIQQVMPSGGENNVPPGNTEEVVAALD